MESNFIYIGVDVFWFVIGIMVFEWFDKFKLKFLIVDSIEIIMKDLYGE